jgi:hypothetical protein
MREISQDILDEIRQGSIRPFLLLNVTVNDDQGVPNHFFYTDCDVPIYFDGNKFEPHPFSVDSINYSTSKIIDEALVEIDVVDQALPFYFVEYTPQGDPIGLRTVLLDDDFQVVGDAAFTLFSGEIDSWNLFPDEKIRIAITNEFARWDMNTINVHSPSCRWKVFGGTECGYTKDFPTQECDRTYASCRDLYSNTDNFGGFRWLPEIEDKIIWWGRDPKVG